MAGNDTFEEAEALRDLERLQGEIEASRRRRRQANDAFDSFLRTFNRREDAPAPPPPVPPPAPSAQPHEPLTPEAAPPPQPHPQPTPPSPAGREPTVPAALTVNAPSRRRPSRLHHLLAVLVIGAGLLAVWRVNLHDGPVTPQPAAERAQESSPPPAPPVQPAAPAAELTTTKAVWVRVLVDGERTIERELPADSKIPLAATKQIVIRAGNAGAVRVFVGGKDLGPLGREGVAVTRTYDINRGTGEPVSR